MASQENTNGASASGPVPPALTQANQLITNGASAPGTDPPALTEANQLITNGASASGTVPPALTEAEADKRSILILLTDERNGGQFEQMMLEPDEADIKKIASQMETDPDYFVKIVRTENGSARVRKLLGLSHEADCHFCKAIVSRFFDITSHNPSWKVTVMAILAFDQDRQRILLDLTLFYVLDLAKQGSGFMMVSTIIKDSYYLDYKNQIMYKVALHAHDLCNDYSGAFVVVTMLQVNNFTGLYVHLALVSLRRHCIELSFTEAGCSVVLQLLGGTAETVNFVVEEIRCCGDNNMLVRLAEDEFGTDVFIKALFLTSNRPDLFHLFMPLVHRLRTIRRSLGNSTRGNSIGIILDATTTPVP